MLRVTLLIPQKSDEKLYGIINQQDGYNPPFPDNPLRPLQNAPFCPISASGSDFNPRNIQYIPVVKILAFLDLDQN
jgi:hypothetical protein